MSHRISAADEAFLHAFTTCAFPPAQFHHREHIRLAYIMVVKYGTQDAVEQMRASLLAFLQHNGVDPAKYHVTLTRAWILAVAHFMHRSTPCTSSDEFVDTNPTLLDQTIMLTHYSRERLFSQDARTNFVSPDLDPIPEHHARH